MKKTLLTLALILGLIPSMASAAPVSWDFANNILQPLTSGKTAEIKGSYFTSTSTTADNTFPNYVAVNGTTTNATSTNFYNSGQTRHGALSSALVITGSTGILANFAGTSCTNQFVRSLSALGAATCATISSADVSLANLSATDSTLTFSGTYTGATARTIGINLANANTWSSLQTITGGILVNNATSTITNLVMVNSTTTNATTTNKYVSSSLTATDRTTTFYGVVNPVRNVTMQTGTTTAWTATTSGAYITRTIAPFNGTIRSAICLTDAGTLGVDVYHTSTHLAYIPTASTTANTFLFTTNNTFTKGEPIYLSAGTPASSPTTLSCTLSVTETP